MIRLSLSATPRWVGLVGGVRVQVARLGADVILEARRDAEVRRLAEEMVAALESGDRDRAARVEERIGMAMARAIGRLVILAWEGVRDEATGEPLEVSPEAVEALLDVWPVMQAFQAEVVAPAMVVESEGNGSGLSPDGGGAGARSTASTATASAGNAPES